MEGIIDVLRKGKLFRESEVRGHLPDVGSAGDPTRRQSLFLHGFIISDQLMRSIWTQSQESQRRALALLKIAGMQRQ